MNKLANLAIKGFIGTSLIDYPGCVASVLFVGGCNFRCPYCHNADLVLRPSSRPAIPTGQLLADLERRRGFVDGVVLTGGEPTLYPALAGLLRAIRAMGFAVKLDTNGSRPDVLRDWLEQGLLDYVAMDVKAPRERYPEIAGREDVDVEAVAASVDVLKHCGRPHEFRTTVVPTLLHVDDVEAIARWIAGPVPYFLQQFQPNGCLDPRLERVQPYSVTELERMATAARSYLGAVQLRGV
ncbi:MAG TPA: anaerobic ribonucleoside-triphosphate reductase activating protein [Anaerolineae bacterium]|nr:anaerobic ribonucleoside-triphosphate reductase activating protein [Anaerolineae bacterium]